MATKKKSVNTFISNIKLLQHKNGQGTIYNVIILSEIKKILEKLFSNCFKGSTYIYFLKYLGTNFAKLKKNILWYMYAYLFTLISQKYHFTKSVLNQVNIRSLEH